MVFPVRCIGCSAEGELLCEECLGKVQLNAEQFCPVCWQPSLGGKVCARCESPLAGLRVAASYERNPELAKAVRTLKYKFSENLAGRLAQILSCSIQQKSYIGERVITPVPLHRKRERWRGFNQAELLATAVAEKLNLPLEHLLVRTKNTPQQAKLSKQERLKNLDDAFTLISKVTVKNKTVILVDDIASTGSTLFECAKVLEKHGAKEVWGLVLARG
ncbi:MAG: ComF family protein [Patescibacteria group bacterium]